MSKQTRKQLIIKKVIAITAFFSMLIINIVVTPTSATAQSRNTKQTLKTSTLDRFVTDLSELAKNKKLPAYME